MSRSHAWGPTMGKRSRDKGHNYERELARELRDRFPALDISRGLKQSRGGGAEEPDVVFPGLHIEAKRQKRPNIRAALEQAIEDATAGVLPVAITRADRDGAVASMRLEDWIELLDSWVFDPERGDDAEG